MVGLLPVIGALKYADEVGTLIKHGDDLADGLRHGDEVVDGLKAETKTVKQTSKRLQYMGKTPSKSSSTGKEVIERMTQEGKVRTVRGDTQFMDGNGKWRPLSEADMAHKTDAVTWWNEVGRNYGPKSKEVREWMLDPGNYYLEHYSLNRSQGAKLGLEYLPPK